MTAAARPVAIPASLQPGSNNGPPLDDSPRPWGAGPIGNFFEWKAAKLAADDVPYDIARLWVRRAAALGLTYAEYALEVQERGRRLGPSDADRIAAIKRRRPIRY